MSDVYVYLYDLSMGLAQQVSESIIGKKIDGIWHTGVVIFDKEIFFGSGGVEYCPPGGTTLRKPLEKIYMGRTEMSEKRFMEHVLNLSRGDFQGCNYKLFSHNCNTFSDTICKYLFGRGIPEHILALPNEVSNTPMGFLLRPVIENMANKINVDQNPENGQHGFAKPIEESEYAQAFVTFKDISKFIYSESFENIGMIEESFKAVKDSRNQTLLTQLKDAILDGINGNEEKLEGLTLDHYNLLDFNNKCTTFEEAIFLSYTFLSGFLCYPDLISLVLVLQSIDEGPLSVQKISTPTKHDQLKVTTPSATGQALALQLESLKAQLICNLLYCFRRNGTDFNLMQYRRVFKFDQIKALIERLLGVDRKIDQLNPSCFMSGVSLALNSAMCKEFSEEYALEYGTFLINFFIELDQEHPYTSNELSILLKAIYALSVRYRNVRQFAEIMSITEKVAAFEFPSAESDLKDLLFMFFK